MRNPFFKYFLFCFLLLKVLVQSFSQDNIDSVQKIIDSRPNINRSESILNLSKEYTNKGDYTKALFYAQEVYNSLPPESTDEFEASLYNQFGLIYSNKLEFDQSLKYYLKSIKLYEKLKDSKSESTVQRNIGQVHRKMRNYKKAIECFNYSLKLGILNKDSMIMANACDDLGAIYYDIEDMEKSLYYFNLGLVYYKSVGDLYRVALNQHNIGSIYTELDRFPEAIANYKDAMDIFSELKDSINYALSLANVGNVYIEMEDFKQGISYALKGLEISTRLKDINNVADCYFFLIDGYKKSGDFSHAFEYQEKFLNLKDSIYDLQTNQNIAEMQTRYDTEKKEKENEILKQKNDIQYLTINRQKIISYSISFGLVLVLILVFYIYRGYKQKQRANLQLEEKNILIEEKNKIVEEKNKDITDSINYAKRIQEAVLPVSDSARAILGEHFILFKPKDIVSGDFYWTTKIDKFLIVAVVDCTGHGVPGAFMSMLGISFLNEIVRKKEVVNASHVLNNLRKEIINALQQKGVTGEQKTTLSAVRDGMDISLIVINLETNECQWAGANNPLYLIAREGLPESNLLIEREKLTENSFRSSGFQLYELKGDKMPIAIHPVMRDFANHQFKLAKGDCIYLFSDGFADQFGGPKNMKFMYKQLKELLLANCDKPMPVQKELLENAFEEWKGDNEQIDDITILGIRI